MIYYVTVQTRKAAGFRRKIIYFAKELEDAIRECEEMARINKRYIWRVYTPQWQLIYTAKEENHEQ